jgi:hypothetical protein
MLFSIHKILTKVHKVLVLWDIEIIKLTAQIKKHRNA